MIEEIELRDYLAGVALNSLDIRINSNYMCHEGCFVDKNKEWCNSNVKQKAWLAYKYADAMLEARKTNR